MQTIIATVGTSLLTNPDRDLPDDARRPWKGQKAIGDAGQAVEWMKKTDLELVSAETNTLFRLDLLSDDVIHLLHSDTPEGRECAEVLSVFLRDGLGQSKVSLHLLPDVNYDMDIYASSLERMSELIEKLVREADSQSYVTLAMTGGFKAQVAMMAIIGNALEIPVCYVHEQYKALIYLPRYRMRGSAPDRPTPVSLPASGTAPDKKIDISGEAHHRPRGWEKAVKWLSNLSWVDRISYNPKAYDAPKNGVKAANRPTKDGRHVFHVVLFQDEERKLPLDVETTGTTDAHMAEAGMQLRAGIGRLFT